MEIEIEDVERGEVVATVSDESGLETDDELAAGTIPVDDDGTVGWLRSVDATEDDNDVAMATEAVELTPGDEGYLYTVVDSLPHPFAPAGDHDLDPPGGEGGGDGDGPDEKGRFPNLPSFLSGSR